MEESICPLGNKSGGASADNDKESSHAYNTIPGALKDNKEMLALEALGQLKNSGTSAPTMLQEPEFGEAESIQDVDNEYYDTSDVSSMASSMSSSQRLYRKMRNHPIVNSAVQVYKSNKPAIKYGVEMVEKATLLPMVNIIGETKEEWRRKRRLSRANSMFPDEAKVDLSTKLQSSKRQKLPSLSEALAVGNKNWNEIGLNMSIESKKRLQTCLRLLMLANKQLSTKVTHLQELISKEQELIQQRRDSQIPHDEDGEVFHDASEEMSATDEIRYEIVGTVKKIVSFISKYGGTSLPEPARTDVREELLRLPNRWASQASSSMFNYNTNAKVLVLANDSLDMVSSVMTVFDETLSRAEYWIKQKQEKQLAKHAIWNNSLKRRDELHRLDQEQAFQVETHTENNELDE
jgi:bZIP factor